MKKKVCPTETFCIDKTILLILLLGILFLTIFFNYIWKGYQENMYFKTTIGHDHYINPSFPPVWNNPHYHQHSHSHSHQPSHSPLSLGNNDVYKDVYAPPLKPSSWYNGIRDYLYPSREILLHGEGHGYQKVPVNVSTNFRGWREYRQVGILTRTDPKDQQRERETILALFGRPVHTSRSKWQYYTMTDKNKGIKLPVRVNGRDGNSSYGCDELFTGDTVQVKGFNDSFEVTVYETETLEYLG